VVADGSQRAYYRLTARGGRTVMGAHGPRRLAVILVRG